MLTAIAVTNPHHPLATKQSPQAKKARMFLHDKIPSRQSSSPIGLATPFLRHLDRPREAEKTEREKVILNSQRPSTKVPSPKMMLFRLSSDPVIILISS